MRIERKNFSGFMNLDDPNEVIPMGHHREANNVIFLGNAGNMRAESIPGNSPVTNSDLRAGTNICIGSYYDELKQRLFYFVYNSNGYDAIYVYDKNAKTISTLLMSKVDSLSTESLFDFSPDYPIASVNILYRTEEDGDILHWTDRNNRPMKLNIKEATVSGKTYSGNWKKKYLTVARLMPLISPICKYESDSTTYINNLRSKVYQFRYRWVYRDFTKSTWSPWSRLFAPENVDILATEIDPTKNNRISITYNSGDSDVISIEIASRQSLDTTFSDPFLVTTIVKSQSSILDNNTYDFKFYNTESYPYLDVTESNLLFDYVPLKCNAQELLNGNVVIYGGITEGLTSNVTINATQTLSLVNNTISNPNPFTATTLNTYTFSYSPTWNVTGGYFTYYMSGVPVNGDVYKFQATLRHGTLATTTVTISTNVTPSDTSLSAIETKIYNLIVANGTFSTYGLTVTKLAGTGGQYGIKVNGNSTVGSWVIAGALTVTSYAGSGIPPDPTGVNTALYKHKSRYSFGMCYFDEYGVTNGVITSDSLKVLTPEIDSSNVGATQLTIPVIQFDISHEAPSWAKYFSFVRTTNLTASDFKTIITTSTQVDAVNKYAYLDITDFQTNKSGYPAYSYASGDRVRIVGRYNNPDLLTNTVSNDYPVIGLLTSTEIQATFPSIPASKIWIKIQYDSATMSGFNFGTINDYYLEVYTPTLSSSAENQLYYEFGETYNVVPTVVSGVTHYYHDSTTQAQTSSLPAIFKFFRGDTYQRIRDNYAVLDRSMSDKFPSKIDGNGRPFVQDPYAKQNYFPTLVRYSLEYQAGTSINQTNRFYSANFDEYDREKGDIQRLKTRGRQLRVFQNRACGVVPVLQSLVQTADGNGVLSQSAEIINRIQYYLGEYGVGTQFCSIASSGQADYFSDPVRGVQVRLSADGITPISELYKGHIYFNPLLVKYNKERTNITGFGKAKILGFYDQYNEQFVTCMQESSGTAPDKTVSKTFGFDEFSNCYTSFYSYSPEWASTAENLVISWKNGILYTHDNTTSYANFYGVQYKPSIRLVFNQYQQLKKRYNTITMLCNKAWIPDTNGDIATNLGQSSYLSISDFIYRDDKLHASFKRDASSTGGIYNGNVLKGNWIEINIKPVNGNEFVNLYYIEIVNLEPFNNR